MAKKASNDPNFSAVPRPKMSDEDTDLLFVHMIRLKGVCEEGLARFPLGLLKHEDDKWRILMTALHRVCEGSKASPGEKGFRALLKKEVKEVAGQFDPEDPTVELADEIASKGGLIDQAYDVDKSDLSAELGRDLLKRFLFEVEAVNPLKALLAECGQSDGVPGNLAAALETALERLRKHGDVGCKAVRPLEEEWGEHEQRLKHYRGKVLIGLKTGLKVFDGRTLGVRGLFILGAMPGAGKTTLAAVEIAIGVCRHHADNDCVVVVVCLDMDRFELYRRIHCNLGDIDWVPLMFGSPEEEREPGSMFSKKHKDCLKRAEQRREDWQVGKRLAVPDRAVLGEDVTARRLASIIEEQKAKAGAKRALLVVDYLQLIPVPEEVAARGDLAADKYRVRLVQQVIERSRSEDDPLGDAAMVISEARKPPTSKEKDRWGDSMSELMGSARLGYAADAVLLYREMTVKEMERHYGVKDKAAAEKKREALREQGVAPITLILEKGRDGMVRGKWGAEFHFRKSTFRELSPNQHLLASAPPLDGAGGTKPGEAGNGSAHLPLPPPGPGMSNQKPGKKANKKPK